MDEYFKYQPQNISIFVKNNKWGDVDVVLAWGTEK